MFKDIDYNKETLEAKYQLAKPNKQIIDNIFDVYDDTLTITLGGIDELEFSIPYKVRKRDEIVDNELTNLLIEKMLVKMTLGTDVSWFIVDSFKEDISSDADTYTVSCFGLSYELNHKKIDEYEVESENISTLATDLLADTPWKLGSIDSKFTDLYRSFSSSGDSVLDCIITLSETFGCLLDWDTEKRIVNFLDPEKEAKYRGLNIDYGRLLETMNKSRTSDEMVTQFYPYGNDGLTIADANPSGLPYLEDFTYFMQPFEYDKVNNKVIKSSAFMSNELCISLTNYIENLELHQEEISLWINKSIDALILISNEETKLNQKLLELDNINDRLDTAKSAEASEEFLKPIRDERDAKISDIATQRIALAEANRAKETADGEVARLQAIVSKEANFTPNLIEELKLYEIQKDWEDENYINAHDLYEDAKKKFEVVKNPKTLIDVSTANLFSVVEEEYYWDKLVLGDIVKVENKLTNFKYYAQILEIQYNFQQGEANLKIADDPELLKENSIAENILYNASNTNNIVSKNKTDWGKINSIGKEVSDLINNEWDANKNTISAGVNNETTIGKRGIMITNPDNPNEVIIMQSGIIALSEDKGETWKTAIRPSGIIAERLIGKIIIGEDLIMSNINNTFQFDKSGAWFNVNNFKVTSEDGINKVPSWNDAVDFVDQMRDDNMVTPYEKKMLKIEWGKMVIRYNGLIERTNNYFDNASELVEYQEYQRRYGELYDYLYVTPMTEKPMLADDNMNQTTRIDRVEFRNMFDNFEKAQEDLEFILAKRNRELQEQNKVELEKIRDEMNQIVDDVPYKITLTSTNGLIFKNNNVDTDIIAKLYKGSVELTTKIPNSGFVWKKFDKDGVEDTEWGAENVAVGNTIHVTQFDINQKVTYSCDIYFDNKPTV